MFKKFKAAPLSSGFMFVSILGFLIIFIYTNSGAINITWGTTLMFFFFLMLIASFISMTKAPVEAELYLDTHEHYARKAKARKKAGKRVVKQKQGMARARREIAKGHKRLKKLVKKRKPKKKRITKKKKAKRKAKRKK